jgi:hypothetical protein
MVVEARRLRRCRHLAPPPQFMDEIPSQTTATRAWRRLTNVKTIPWKHCPWDILSNPQRQKTLRTRTGHLFRNPTAWTMRCQSECSTASYLIQVSCSLPWRPTAESTTRPHRHPSLVPARSPVLPTRTLVVTWIATQTTPTPLSQYGPTSMRSRI